MHDLVLSVCWRSF